MDWILVQRSAPGPAIQPFTDFPGRAANPVGFAAAPGFPGSLTASSGPFTSGSPGSPTIISFKDFDAGVGSTNIDANWVTFVGCRFQSNSGISGNCVSTGGTGAQNVVFSYCSFVPRVALVGSTPPGATWPSAGAGQGLFAPAGWTTGVNCVAAADSYQFSLDFHNATDGPLTFDHCDFWGFGNATAWASTTAQITFRDCWFHDARNGAAPTNDHTDGPGALNNTVNPTNITIDHCTIASIGSQNGIALQGGTTGYDNVKITRNFISGFNNACILGTGSAVNTNWTFTDNVFGTDLPWVNFPCTENFAEWVSPGGVWRRNKFRVLPGTSPAAGNQWGINWTQADDGKFVLPNVNTTVTLSATDYAG